MDFSEILFSNVTYSPIFVRSLYNCDLGFPIFTVVFAGDRFSKTAVRNAGLGLVHKLWSVLGGQCSLNSKKCVTNVIKWTWKYKFTLIIDKELKKKSKNLNLRILIRLLSHPNHIRYHTRTKLIIGAFPVFASCKNYNFSVLFHRFKSILSP